MKVKKSAPKMTVANLKEVSPDPGSAENENIAAIKVINAKSKVHPNISLIPSLYSYWLAVRRGRKHGKGQIPPELFSGL